MNGLVLLPRRVLNPTPSMHQDPKEGSFIMLITYTASNEAVLLVAAGHVSKKANLVRVLVGLGAIIYFWLAAGNILCWKAVSSDSTLILLQKYTELCSLES